MATNKTKKLKYGELAEGNTPEATNTPPAVPGQSALVSAGYGTEMTPAVGAGARTAISYGEFMARKNAAGLASAIESGNVGAGAATGATYAQGTGTQPPAGWNSGISFAPSATEGGTEAPTSDGKTVRDLIEEQRQASYAEAEAARERATVDAMTSYQKNLATYGTKAENLASGGLSGSGYGEYLQGQAYAQQRADIQAAARGEAAAKREADRVYYADMMVQTEKDMAQTEKDNATYASLLDAAKSGSYTADEIGNLAEKYGITDENDLAMLKNATGSEKIKSVSADTTDEQIAEMIANGEISAENAQAAKDARREAAENEIATYVDSENYADAETAVEKYYKNGAIDDNDRQSFYMQKHTSDIEKAAQKGEISAKNVKTYEQQLERAKNEGKISQADFEAAKKYLYECITTVVDGANVEFTAIKAAMGEIDPTFFDIEINGKKIGAASHSKKTVEKSIQNVLDSVAGSSPAEGTTVLYDDGVYIYINSRGNNGWYKASRDWTKEGIISAESNRQLYEILKNDIAPTRARPTKPEHTAG